MQKLIVLAALLALAWYGTRVLANMPRLRGIRAAARKPEVPAKRLRLDEKTGLYVPADD